MTSKRTPLAIAQSAQLLPSIASTLIRLRRMQTLRSLVVTSCNAGEGKTTIALALANAAVLEGNLSVLLVDCNPANPQLAALLGCESAPGFADYLDEQADAGAIIRTTDNAGLDVVPFGGNQPGRVSRYEPGHLRDKLKGLRRADGNDYSLVVVDGPSGFGEPDLAMSAGVFDGVILGIECGRTRWEVVRHYEARLRESNANLLGVVLNKRKYVIPRRFYV